MRNRRRTEIFALSRRRLASALLPLALLAACGSDVSKWERENEARLAKDENEVLPKRPPFPQPASLIQFSPRSASEFRFYVDGATLEVLPKGVIRYVLVARSPSGIDNISYESMRCQSAEFRIYALGQADGTWGGRATEWRSIAAAKQPSRIALHRDFFCAQGTWVSSVDEGRMALRRGGHPNATGFSGDDLLLRTR